MTITEKQRIADMLAQARVEPRRGREGARVSGKRVTVERRAARRAKYAEVR